MTSMICRRPLRIARLLPALLLSAWLPSSALAVLGNSWHLPANNEPVGVTMRNPLFPCNQETFFYNGTYSIDSDQSGGYLVFRDGGGNWTSNSLSFDSAPSDNKYWKAPIPYGTFCNNTIIEYYFKIEYTDDDDTWLGSTNNTGSTAYTTEATAQANPFVFTNNNCDFGNTWHIPANAEPPGATMRNPPTNGVNPGDLVAFYNGNQFQGGAGAGDQSGGTLYHRESGSGGGFSTVGMSFDTTDGNNRYWRGEIAGGTYSGGDTAEYYLGVNYTDHNTTWLGTSNNTDSVLMGCEADAAANPFTFTYGAHLGNGWHFPTNTEPPGVTMRDPTADPQTNQSVFIYNGNQFQGGGNAADQNGGYVVHRRAGELNWSTNAMVFNFDSGEVANNKYWKGEIPGGAYDAGDTVEYFLRVTYSDRDDTYIGTTDGDNNILSDQQSTVEAQPFSYTYSGQLGQEAAYVWHADNRVVSDNRVEFWAKIGYAEGTGSNRYVDAAHIYYSTNGTPPHGDHGSAASPNTFVADMSFSHMEQDGFEGGDAMWWHGTVTGLPYFTPIQYKIGAYKEAATRERFADYNTSGIDSNTFNFTLGVEPEGFSLTVNGVEADYTTTKFFVDEIAGDMEAVVVVFSPNDPDVDVSTVEVLSNLDRRDAVDVDYTNALIAADGIPDGIKPPNANFLTPADTGAYFRAYTMAQDAGDFLWTGKVSKTGAYRLTARYRTNGAAATEYIYYTDTAQGRRDHAIVVSPKKALEMTLYELNTLTVEAQAPNEVGRSTFSDLLSTNDVGGDDDTYDPFNLEYLDALQVNCLWFQPIHPDGEERAEFDPAGGGRYMPGSPYATRDYWEVFHQMGAGGTEEDALIEFTNFVGHCDSYTGSVGTINVMLDGVFNHTSWDAEMGQGAVDLGFASDKNEKIGDTRPQWNALITDYGEQASFYNSAFDNDFATAPDRGDFGKWADVTELYFGKYAALVRHNPDNNGDYLNEGDWFDFADMNSNQVDLWRYFAYYTEYWLKKTGHSGANSFVQALDDRGIDALRCDFGQGLPPQCWEWIINKTRQIKWNFVFMAETLDGGIPGYRSNRHFDILNENLVFLFTQAKINDQQQLVDGLESRTAAFSGGAVLLNQTSHDEVMPDNDPWVTAARFGAVSSVAGLPMIFYGQEDGIGLHNSADPNNFKDGFAEHELNFGKYVPHFKRWNQLQIWFNEPPDNAGLTPWYGRVNWARLNSPALRSRNRWFLDLVGGGRDARIFAVAKYETAGAGPLAGDVVLAFSRFIEHGAGHTGAANTYDLRGGGDVLWGRLGLDTNKLYTVRNLAAFDPGFLFTNGWPQAGASLYNNGIFVDLPVDTVGSITDDGHVVQYLKVVEVTKNLDYDSDNDTLRDGWEWANFTTLVYNASTDNDSDGVDNGSEQLADTNPADEDSFFRVETLDGGGGQVTRMITVPTQPGLQYAVQYADGSYEDAAGWAPFNNLANGIGTWMETSTVATTYTFIDDETAATSGGPPVSGARTYRVLAK